MTLSANIALVVAFPDPKIGIGKVRAVFLGLYANKAHSYYIRNINKCPSIEFFRLNNEESVFSVGEQLEIEAFLHRLDE